jgi:uncharacterized protein
MSHSSSKETSGASGNSKPNRLVRETSPYLLQHAYNPVEWFPWGKEAFEKAKLENKPIFLSIGYSSCHWCHVMAHESFEDPETAKLLNDNFVSIKVDREELPDVDEIYMKAIVSMTGSGGWPLSVFLTPTLEPFYGGTYFPPTPRYGMPSFPNLLRNISQAWKSDRKGILQSASQTRAALKAMYETKAPSDSKLDESVLQDCFDYLASSYDELYGGFGSAPKFPTPSNLFFLMRYSKRVEKKDPASANLAVGMVRKTIDGMLAGGICDQIGGGFHRYSTDRQWITPHFEKMLYDNALLVQALCEIYLITKNEDYARAARSTLTWALREMRSMEGGFYAALDADSPEGEGAYYVWTIDDLKKALSSDSEISAKWQVVSSYYSITNEGNFEDGKTILTTKKIENVAKEFGLTSEEVSRIIARGKNLMLEYRGNRMKPTTDVKQLTSWNGLMISALSRAFGVFENAEYLDAAVSAANFELSYLKANHDKQEKEKEDLTPSLRRSYNSGEWKGDAVLEDYSFLANGLIDLYEASFNPDHLLDAIKLAEEMIARFYDKTSGGFFMTSAGKKNLIARPKDAFDGAIPSGNSVASLICLRLGEITGREDLKNYARSTFLAFWSSVTAQPYSFTEMLSAFSFYSSSPKEIVISGGGDPETAEKLIRVVRSEYLPNSVLLQADGLLQNISPLVEGRTGSPNEKTKAYVCSNFSCKLPSSTPEELLKSLRE